MKNSRKRIISFMVVLLMVVSSFNYPCYSQAAPVKVTSISVKNCTTGKLTLIKGKTYKLNTVVLPVNAGNKKLTFSSSKKKIATVSSKGKIKAKKTGKTTITVRSKENKKILKRIKLSVVKKSKFKKIKKLEYTGTKAVDIGKKIKLSVKISPANASNKNLTFTTSNPDIATVDDYGVVTGKKAGKANIKAQSNDGSKKSLQVQITVKAPAKKTPVKKMVDKISVSAPSNEVSLGKTLTLKVSVSPADAANKEVTFTSSDASVATVSSTGLVTPVAVGKTVIKVKAKDGSERSGQITIKVIPQVTKDNIPLAIGGDESDKLTDSDKDGLTDYEEYALTNTDPSFKDTDGDGITDDKDDEDGDRLSNRDEINLGSNPISNDSDNDLLTDDKEVKTYKTSPLKADTDEDTLSDYDEIQLGLDPLNPKTDGVTPDADRTFDKEISTMQIEDSLLTKDNLMKPSLVFENANNEVLNNISIKKSVSFDLPDDRYIVGKAIDIEKESLDFRGKIQFNYNSDSFSEAELKKFVICTVKDGEFVPVNTSIDNRNNCLTATVDSEGTYFVLNMVTYLASLGFSESKLLSMNIEAKTDVSFTNLVLNAEGLVRTLDKKEVHYYSFKPESTAMYYIYADSSAGDMNTILYESDGTVIDKSNVGNTYYAYELTAGKTYCLAVAFRYISDTGEYSVGWQQAAYDADGVPQRYTVITGDTETVANISVAGDTIYYKFVPEETAYYDFSSSADGDTYGIILDENGEILEEVDDSSDDSNFKIHCILDEGSVYYLGVRYYDFDTVGSIPVTFKKYVYKPDVSFSLNETSDWDNIPISLASGEQAFISFTPEENGYYVISSSGSYDTTVYLYNSVGEQIDYNDDDEESANFSLNSYLEEGKLYYYCVGEFNLGETEFTVTFAKSDEMDASADSETQETAVTREDTDKKGIEPSTGPDLSALIEADSEEEINKEDEQKSSDKVNEGKTVIQESEPFRKDVGGRTVTADAYQGQADIVFAIDTTGSMDDVISSVAENVNLFVTKLSEDYNVQVNFALVDYKDIEEDGSNSTVIVKNGVSNWFDDVSAFKKKVSALDADGGGDEAESAIDALETARNLGFRTGVSKFIILITDADYKKANRYGINSMDEEIQKLVQDDIHVSVVSSSEDKASYGGLYTKTKGIWADIYGDFNKELLLIADSIGENTSNGVWVLLRGDKYVKLAGDPEEGLDTDHDGITDKEELGVLRTKSIGPVLTYFLDALGIYDEIVEYDSNVKYYDYTSNPVLEDSDSDGIKDKEDTAKLTKGLEGGVIGELTIVSCHPNDSGMTGGHAWLAYKSYVNDTLDFSKLLFGFKYDFTKKEFYQCDPGKYDMTPNSYVAIGNAGTEGTSGAISTIAGSCGGILYNREFYGLHNDEYFYIDVAAYTRKITQSKLDKVIKYCSDNCYYNLYTHNCSHVASEGWETAFGTEDGMKAIRSGITAGVSGMIATPQALKENILKKSDADKDYRSTMLKILKNWR